MVTKRLLEVLQSYGLVEQVPPPLSAQELMERISQMDVITQAYLLMEGHPNVIAKRMEQRWNRAFEIKDCGRWEATQKGRAVGVELFVLFPLSQGKSKVVIPEEVLEKVNSQAFRLLRKGVLQQKSGDHVFKIPVVELALEEKKGLSLD